MRSLAADSEFVWFSRSPTSGASVCDLMQWVVSAKAWAYHPVPQGYLRQVVVGSDGTVYAVGPEGLYMRVVMGPRSEFRPVGAKGADLIAADKRGGVWVASRETGWMWHYAGGKLTPHGPEFYGGALQQLTVDSQNRLWAALNESLSVYDGMSWRGIATPLRQIRVLTSGPDGRIWLVGDIGVAVYDPAADKQP
jgi:ligand-binding sensor domain-containing protein